MNYTTEIKKRDCYLEKADFHTKTHSNYSRNCGEMPRFIIRNSKVINTNNNLPILLCNQCTDLLFSQGYLIVNNGQSN